MRKEELLYKCEISLQISHEHAGFLFTEQKMIKTMKSKNGSNFIT